MKKEYKSDLYALILKHSNVEYDRKRASQIILLIKHCEREHKIEQYKFELFKLSAKLLIKAINNFFKLVENIPEKKILHENIDIVSECWLIFDRCVKNIKIKDHSKYNFYLNTSLNRGIHRVYEKYYKKHFDVVTNDQVMEFGLTTAKSSMSMADLTELDLSMNFSEIEIKIINFKISGEKQVVFLKNENMTNTQYSELFEGIKEKILNLYKRE